MPVQVETCMPEPATQAQSTPTNSSGSLLAYSVAEINHPPGTGASRVFQILYRNEEVTLKDVILFRAHLLGESEFKQREREFGKETVVNDGRGMDKRVPHVQLAVNLN